MKYGCRKEEEEEAKMRSGIISPFGKERKRQKAIDNIYWLLLCMDILATYMQKNKYIFVFQDLMLQPCKRPKERLVLMTTYRTGFSIIVLKYYFYYDTT